MTVQVSEILHTSKFLVNDKASFRTDHLLNVLISLILAKAREPDENTLITLPFVEPKVTLNSTMSLVRNIGLVFDFNAAKGKVKIENEDFTVNDMIIGIDHVLKHSYKLREHGYSLAGLEMMNFAKPVEFTIAEDKILPVMITKPFTAVPIRKGEGVHVFGDFYLLEHANRFCIARLDRSGGDDNVVATGEVFGDYMDLDALSNHSVFVNRSWNK